MGTPAIDQAQAKRSRDTVAQSVATGIVCGLLAIVLSIGNGVLLFGDGLQAYTPVSVGMALFATTVMAAVAALTSPNPGTVAVVQEVPVVALAAVITVVHTGMPQGAAAPEIMATVILVVVVTTVASGAVALALGYFRLGNIVRFVPYPVIGGFLAGTGWLIVLGGLGLVIGEPVTLQLLLHAAGHLSEGPTAANAALALGVVAVLAVTDRLTAGGLAAPIVILAALILFNVARLAIGISPEDLRAIGWLVQLPGSGSLWPPLPISEFDSVDWLAVANGAINLPTVIVVTIVALLMNTTGVELATGRDADLNRELRSVGLANVVSGLGAGMPGFVSVSLTLVAHRLGGATRVVGLVVAAVALSALAFGSYVLTIVPTFLLGAMLIWVGGGLLVEWVIRAYGRLGGAEYAIILLIFLVIAGVDFTTGILVGMIAAVVLFVVIYSRVDIVRAILSGADYGSRFETSEERRSRIRSLGEAILIFRLQGFLFFGTADRLRQDIEARIAAGTGPELRYLIIDFRRVSGLDSSAVLSFLRLEHFAARSGVRMVLCGMSEGVQRSLYRAGLQPKDGGLHAEDELDRAAKWCERQLLGAAAPARDAALRQPLRDLFTDILGRSEMVDKVTPSFQRQEAPAGTILIAEGAGSDDIYLFEAGQASVETRSEEGRTVRLATIGPGSIVGEVAFYAGLPRSASIVIETDAVIWRLSRDSLDRLRGEMPEVASEFHRGVAVMLARRLVSTNRLVHFLAD